MSLQEIASPSPTPQPFSQPTRSRRKAIATNEKRCAALDFALKLSKLAEEAPDSIVKNDLNRAIHQLRLRSSQSIERKREAVLLAIEHEAHEPVEIADDTGLELADVLDALEYLTSPSVDLVEIRTPGGKRNSGRGGTRLLYYFTHTGASQRLR